MGRGGFAAGRGLLRRGRPFLRRHFGRDRRSAALAHAKPPAGWPALNLATGQHKLVSAASVGWCGVGPNYKPATVPSFAGTTVDGLTVTSNSSEVAAVPAGSA